MKEKYCYEYPRPMVTVDILVFCKHMDGLNIMLIKREKDPFKDYWAFPGGFIEMNETLIESAKRELYEETGLTNIDLKVFNTYGDPGRDPRGRTITIVYYCFVDKEKVNIVISIFMINDFLFDLK